MNKIISELNQLLACLKQGLSVRCRHDHTWYIERKGVSLLLNRLGLNSGRLLSVAYTLNNYFSTIERFPVKFNPTSKEPGENEINYADLSEVSKKLISDLNKILSPDSLRLVNQLKRKFIALQYRLESVNGGADKTSIQKDLLSLLQKLAKEWKKGEKNLLEKYLLEKDLIALAETSRYPLFCETLFSNQDLQKAYFEWILRDRNPVGPFIEFPTLQQCLVDSTY
jgi:hypothetical protein